VSLGILAVAYFLSYVDRQLPFILAESIKVDLDLSDTQLGLITGLMFALVYSTAAIPMARLADRGSRKHMIAGAILVWSLLTAAGGLAKNFWHLAISRIGVAAGESVLTPAAHSLIGDHFTRRYRARALAVYVIGAQLGALAGLWLGGLINELADWRTAMFLLGAPGIALSFVVVLFLREPKRTQIGVEAEDEPRPSFIEVVKRLARQPTLVHLVLASTLAGVGNGGLQAFLPAYMHRTFDIGTAKIGLTLGLVWGLGGVFGTLLSGFLGDRLRRHTTWQAMAMVTVGELLAIPTMVLALVLGNLPLFLALVMVSQIAGGLNGPPTYATLQSLMKPNTYAQTTAIYLFCVSGLGLAFGPLFTGMLSDSMASKGSQGSLQAALVMLTGVKIWAVAHYFLSTLHLRRRDNLGAVI
jgi:predicted MFS family arabinose efflux permease